MTQGNLSLQHVPASCPAPCTLVGDQPRSQGHSSFTLGTRLVSVRRNSTCTGTDFCGGDLVASHPLWRRKKKFKKWKMIVIIMTELRCMRSAQIRSCNF